MAFQDQKRCFAAVSLVNENSENLFEHSVLNIFKQWAQARGAQGRPGRDQVDPTRPLQLEGGGDCSVEVSKRNVQ